MIHECPLEIVVATSNRGKMREIRTLLGDLELKLRFLTDFPQVKPVKEVGITYEENAVIKAQGYWEQTGLPCLADDSGLECDALGGRPGPLSSRFGEHGATDEQKSQKILAALDQSSVDDRTARFVCCMALVGAGVRNEASQNAHGQLLHLVLSECNGKIAELPLGKNGFGYDPIFIPAGYNATFAELPIEIKNTISHRAKALSKMRVFLERWIEET